MKYAATKTGQLALLTLYLNEVTAHNDCENKLAATWKDIEAGEASVKNSNSKENP